MHFKFQTHDLTDCTAVVEHLRQLNIRITEELERQKVKSSSVTSRMDQIQGSHQVRKQVW